MAIEGAWYGYQELILGGGMGGMGGRDESLDRGSGAVGHVLVRREGRGGLVKWHADGKAELRS